MVEDGDDGSHLVEVFCSHDGEGSIFHLSFGTNTDVDKVVEGGKEDTWVLVDLIYSFPKKI
jgi:hypothetical protein